MPRIRVSFPSNPIAETEASRRPTFNKGASLTDE
jgi:hypothetical protein